MVDEDIVQREARTISHDCDLPDTESTVLRDLLKSDEAFGALVTAQQNAVLVNTAVATAGDPVAMARAFAAAVEAAQLACEADPRGEKQLAEASSPLTGFLST